MVGERLPKIIQIAAATIQGPWHLQNGLPNQDSFAYYHANSVMAVAVADGLGSAKLSERGAAYATRCAITQLINFLYEYEAHHDSDADIIELKKEIIGRWQMKFMHALEEYDSTLLYVGVTPSVCVMGQIGDGLILYKWADSDVFSSFHEENKEYLNTPNATLAQPDAYQGMHVDKFVIDTESSFSAFILMTDGISDDLKDPNLYSQELIANITDTSCGNRSAYLEKHLADWPTPGHYDDKTIVLVTFDSRLDSEDREASLKEQKAELNEPESALETPDGDIDGEPLYVEADTVSSTDNEELSDL